MNSEAYWRDWQQTSAQQKVKPSLLLCGNHVLTMVSTRVEGSVLRALIPQGAELGAPGPDGKYLILYTFGYQQFVRYCWVPPLLSVSYLETIVGIPAVFRNGTGPYSALGKLYLNNRLATILGRLIGYPKFLKTMTTGPRSYRIDGVAAADFDPNGRVVNPFDDPAYQEFQELAGAKGITRAIWGSYLLSTVEIDEENSLAQPVKATIQIETDDFPGLPRGFHRFEGSDENPLTALRARIPWKLSMSRAPRK